ncbi:MAG: hypothetical protein ACRC10_08815 [Thermoguttaceae bacterium]
MSVLSLISFGTVHSATQAVYVLKNQADSPDHLLKQLTIELGDTETVNGQTGRWCSLQGEKVNGQSLTVWVFGTEFFPKTLKAADQTLFRYIFQEEGDVPREYVHVLTGKPLFPTMGGWEYIWPQPVVAEEDSFAKKDSSSGNVAKKGEKGSAFFVTDDQQQIHFPNQIDWLGHVYDLQQQKLLNGKVSLEPGEIKLLRLQPDVLVGVPSNSRTKDDTRRYDGSDYEMVRLTRENYAEMIEKGLNCLRVDEEQRDWIKDEPIYYWGMNVATLPFPEILYRTPYIGPVIFFDEPGVSTRDYDIRPRLEKEPEFRRDLTVQLILDEYKRHFNKSVFDGPPTVLMKGLQARKDIDLGTMKIPQRNLYTWETLVAGSVWELMYESDLGPRTFVFEPPGRIGTRRTIPEFNMSYGCQLSPNNPAHFAPILFGFMRGAARMTGKDWGLSIYGAVDRADAPWLLTSAYDLGATHFFYWDNYQSACVPYSEYLALTRHLQSHIKERPERNLERLKQVGEVVILLPPGYDLGHTHTGRGNLWGLGELNLERKNSLGVKYRTVMSHFFTEVERYLKLGTPFDLLWDIEGLDLSGYREIVRVREDGQIEVITKGKTELLSGPRVPERTSGQGPTLEVTLNPGRSQSGQSNESGQAGQQGKLGRSWTARAVIREGDAPIYYTPGTDRRGLYPNVMVLWELYGPNEEDYRQLSGIVEQETDSAGIAIVETRFSITQPGQYRLRVATCDTTGRTEVVWKELTVEP